MLVLVLLMSEESSQTSLESPSDGIGFDNTIVKFDSNVYTMDRVNYEVFSGGIGTSFNFGDYSWGKINLNGRPDAQPFNSHTGNGYSGINTSSYVRRFQPVEVQELRY